MRLRLLGTAVRIGAEKGPAALTIDDIVVGAEVARGSFYKYFPSIDALLREVATQIANELIRAAEPVVQNFQDPAERVACGIRLVSRASIAHPAVAAFLVRLGWPDVRRPDILLDFVRRDLAAGIRQRRFVRMPVTVALNITTGAVLGAALCMVRDDCERDFPEQTAGAVLRALGLPPEESKRISTLRLADPEWPTAGLFAAPKRL
jgi:AcrR family transcriptional regulator